MSPSHRSSVTAHSRESAWEGSQGWEGDGQRARYAPLAPVAVVPYLSVYGYEAADPTTWRARQGPTFDLQVQGHDEVEGHTLYLLKGSLKAGMLGAAGLEWRTRRRLVQLREDLHDSIKEELDETYRLYFASAPFAHQGGIPGTTARLNTWCGALASCVNSGKAPPTVVALVLHFLEAPEPPQGQQQAVEADDVEISLGPLCFPGDQEEDHIPPEEVLEGSGPAPGRQADRRRGSFRQPVR